MISYDRIFDLMVPFLEAGLIMLLATQVVVAIYLIKEARWESKAKANQGSHRFEKINI